jgi:hypothetical protein
MCPHGLASVDQRLAPSAPVVRDHSARQHHAAGDGTSTVGDDGDVMFPDLALAGFAS